MIGQIKRDFSCEIASIVIKTLMLKYQNLKHDQSDIVQKLHSAGILIIKLGRGEDF